MPEPRAWPNVIESGRWAIDLMEELLADPRQSPGELLARAKELRAQAADADLQEHREVALALAERYEAAATERLTAH